MQEFSNKLISLLRYSRRAIIIIIDIILCLLSALLALNLFLEEITLSKDINTILIVAPTLLAIPIFWFMGLYQTINRLTDVTIIIPLFKSIFIYGFFYLLIIWFYDLPGVPESFGLIQPIILFFVITCSRILIKNILNRGLRYRISSKKKNVLIYGAGGAGRQLILALENSPEYQVVGFLDDDDRLHKQILLGYKVNDLSRLDKLILAKDVDYIFLAMPSIGRSKRNQILKNLNKYQIIVKTLPSISEIIDGSINISDIKDLDIDDLLNRKEVEPDVKLLSQNIFQKIVMITGAGGSIGSELCRQIIRLKPRKILILELNEFALYKIHEELKSYNLNHKIIPLLTNVQDQTKLEIILETFKVDTVYHAAAYKHVPLVEENICEGVKNNVFSTLSIAKASISKKVSNLVFISSDKAVRPTNIMGASKRLSELCMQGLHQNDKKITTKFSIVRFGNVLESSGSVIPKFKKQIKEGGPVTLTHEDVTRYFMTVKEAAQLVIQAGAMGKNSEVFVLDMGESVKIKDLIHKMITLSGLTIKNHKNLSGDIEIKITGLRPGEKLYEELLIGDNPQKTNHSKIQKIDDPFIPFNQLEKELKNLKALIHDNNSLEVKNFLKKLLKSYSPHSKVVDHIYAEKLH
jgi:FlaA1/EpsC-like NDP-sugar epimerase